MIWKQRLAAARERVRELSRDDTMDMLRSARDDQLTAERDLALARGERYAQVINIGPRWDAGPPLPPMVSNGSRTFVVCLASQRDPPWNGTYVPVVSPADAYPLLFVVTEMWGCSEVRSAVLTMKRSAIILCMAKGLAAGPRHRSPPVRTCGG
jgi:hypothetical protein